MGELTLPESQCGFRKGSRCVDMVFVIREKVENSREHIEALFVLFVDLRKAYALSEKGHVGCTGEVWHST